MEQLKQENQNIEQLPKKEKFAEGLYVSWEVISTCDLECQHCYSLNEEKSHDFKKFNNGDENDSFGKKRLTLEDIKTGLKNLEEVGVKYFNVEGGEPTLRNDVLQILDLAKEHGMKTVLSSHSMHLLSKKDKERRPLAEALIGRLDTLAISLEASTAEVNNAIRPNRKSFENTSGHFEKVIEFLKWYGEEFMKKKGNGEKIYALKINTAVMKTNLDSILGIGKILTETLPRDAGVQWKLVQFQPRGKGVLSKDQLSVSDEQFAKVSKEAEEKYGNYLKIKKRAYKDEIYPFIAIGYNGDAVIPKGESQNVVEDNKSRKLNVLKDDFYDILHQHINDNPEFIKKNSEINNY